MTCYLLHFTQPYKHARHYLGFTDNLIERLEAHRAGHGARLMEVVKNAGIDFVLARTWPGDRREERRLKNYHKARQLCPVCNMREATPTIDLAALEAIEY